MWLLSISSNSAVKGIQLRCTIAEFCAPESAEVIVADGDRAGPSAAPGRPAGRGYRRVACEGGPRLPAQIAQAGCLDELCLTLSALTLAGSPPCITNGHALTGSLDLDLVTVAEDEDYLYLRYALRGTVT